MVSINIGRKEAVFFGALIILFLAVGLGVSYGGNQPSVMGHSAGELNISLECVSGGFWESTPPSGSQRYIYPSSKGITYTFDSVFIAENKDWGNGKSSPSITCILNNGWTLTGCSAKTDDLDAYDNDETMRDENSCYGNDDGSVAGVTARCCRLV